jgi:hypothetical protein
MTKPPAGIGPSRRGFCAQFRIAFHDLMEHNLEAMYQTPQRCIITLLDRSVPFQPVLQNMPSQRAEMQLIWILDNSADLGSTVRVYAMWPISQILGTLAHQFANAILFFTREERAT